MHYKGWVNVQPLFFFGGFYKLRDKNYPIFSLDNRCIICKSKLIGINKMGYEVCDLDNAMYSINKLKCPKCNIEFFPQWKIKENNELMIPRSYNIIDEFTEQLKTKLNTTT